MLSLNPNTWLNPEKTSSRFGSWSHRSGDGSAPRGQRLSGGTWTWQSLGLSQDPKPMVQWSWLCCVTVDTSLPLSEPYFPRAHVSPWVDNHP